MQHAHPVTAFSFPHLSTYFALFLSWFAHVTVVVRHVGTTVLALGSAAVCLLAVLPCVFLATIAAQAVLSSWAWVYE